MSRSFKHIVGELYYNELFDSIKVFIQNKKHSVTLSRIHIKSTRIRDSQGTEILFSIIVMADLEGMWHNWFRVKCRADIDDGIHNFEVLEVSIYDRCKITEKFILTDALVPIISKQEFDEVAEQFLRDFYPEALDRPMPLPVKEVTKRMGLNIKEIQITKHLSVFGQVTFSDCTLDYFDPSSRNYKKMEVTKGTILLDPNAYFMRNIGNINNTIIHECFHWYKHRKHHELEKLYKTSKKHISCNVSETIKNECEWTPKDWMEWQANGITPRILMPQKTTRIKIEELIERASRKCKDRLKVMETVVRELAQFFQVSKTAAKIRMFDLGYTEVKSVLAYIDNQYIPSCLPCKTRLANNQVYCIGVKNAFEEYHRNQEFKEMIDSGHFIYVDGRYVINHPLYIKRIYGGGLALTDYAKSHIDECCLVFDIQINKVTKKNTIIYLDSIMFRSAVADYNKTPIMHKNNHNMMVFTRSAKLKRLHDEIIEESEFLNSTTSNFAQLAYTHIRRKGYNKEVFIERTLLSGRTYDRIKNNQLTNPELETVIAICVGLELDPSYSQHLLEVAGFKLGSSPKHIVYKKLLSSYYGHSIYEWNEILEAPKLQ